MQTFCEMLNTPSCNLSTTIYKQQTKTFRFWLPFCQVSVIIEQRPWLAIIVVKSFFYLRQKTKASLRPHLLTFKRIRCRLIVRFLSRTFYAIYNFLYIMTEYNQNDSRSIDFNSPFAVIVIIRSSIFWPLRQLQNEMNTANIEQHCER